MTGLVVREWLFVAFGWLPSANVVDIVLTMPQTTTRPAKKKPQSGLSVKIAPETYGRVEEMKRQYPSLTFDACIRVALNAWDRTTEEAERECVLEAIQS